MLKIITAGCFGRMGTVVCRLAAENPGMEVVAGVDILSEGEVVDFPVFADIGKCEVPADVIIDFLPPTAVAETLAVLDYSVSRQVPLVLCTTGIPPEVEAAIDKATEKVAILRSGNMSLGVNLLSGLIRRVTRLLYDSNFDIEIIEKHHNQKLDAPSGTAVLLADSINGALDGKMRCVNDRSQKHEKRGRNEIGMHALRGGTIVGEHSVVFAGMGEVIELTHIAQSRDIFGVGALKAAEFLRGKPAGLYSMADLIEGGADLCQG